MVGAEVVVGYLFAWLVRKAKIVGGRADAEVDQALETGMDRLHDLVRRNLTGDPALERAREEAEGGGGELSERTRRRLVDSLEDAAERDEEFAAALRAAVEDLQTAAREAGGAVAFGDGVAVAGDVEITASSGSAAAWRIDGPVTIGVPNPQQPGAEKG